MHRDLFVTNVVDVIKAKNIGVVVGTVSKRVLAQLVCVDLMSKDGGVWQCCADFHVSIRGLAMNRKSFRHVTIVVVDAGHLWHPFHAAERI
jgi:hypothetical protein